MRGTVCQTVQVSLPIVATIDTGSMHLSSGMLDVVRLFSAHQCFYMPQRMQHAHALYT